MDSSRDFIQWLGQDMSMKILMCLDDPVDLVRATAVSSSWRQLVITNGICKQLCLRMFPESSSFTRVVEVKNMVEPVDTEMDEFKELQYLAIEHRAYASLSHSLSSFPKIRCIADAIFASSTDNYPRESILNTLEQSDRVDRRASYWSSKGASNVATPESLVYKLSSQLCVVDEVHIHPFQAYFQYGFPIYSAKAVRFHMGKYKAQMEVESSKRNGIFDTQEFSDDRFSWTYTSPEFPMVQENCLQKFSLPEPVLCIGGILKVELLGRVQTQEMDGLYYFCINHVQVVGRPLSPAFDIEMLDEQGKCSLKYYPEAESCVLSPYISLEEAESSSVSDRFQRFGANLRTWEQMILNTFRGARPVMMEYDDDSDDNEYNI